MLLTEGLLNYAERWVHPHVYIFTGNPVIKQNGAIVMGRGAAKQVRDTYPGIDRKFGDVIKAQPDRHLAFLNLRSPESTFSQYIGWFKVKHHWQQPADLELIRESTTELAEIADQAQDLMFHMNFPGIGNGKLKVEDVLPVLQTLPDNVRIYK